MKIKRCGLCKATNEKGLYLCRGCGAWACRHLCRYKAGSVASCGKCQQGFMRPGAVEA